MPKPVSVPLSASNSEVVLGFSFLKGRATSIPAPICEEIQAPPLSHEVTLDQVEASCYTRTHLLSGWVVRGAHTVPTQLLEHGIFWQLRGVSISSAWKAFPLLSPNPSLFFLKGRLCGLSETLSITFFINVTEVSKINEGRKGLSWLTVCTSTVSQGEKGTRGSWLPRIHSQEGERDKCWCIAHFLLLFSLGLQPKGWCCQYQVWVRLSEHPWAHPPAHI